MRALTCLAVLLALGVAAAQGPSEADKETVRQLWADGATKFQQGDVFGAITAWEAALKLDPENQAIKEKISGLRAELITASVVKIVDGSSLVVRLDGEDTTVRLIGVKAPVAGDGEQASTAAREATAFLAEMLDNRSVYLRRDPEIAAGDETMLAYVYRAPDGLFINREMVSRGHGRAATGVPFRYFDAFREAERQAWVAKRGMWSVAPTVRPPDGNLVRNPGLEDPIPEDMLPPGWAYFSSPDGKYVSKLTRPGHDSEHCWSVEGRGEWGGVLCARTRVRAEKCYLAGGWVRVVGPGQATLKIDYYNQDKLLDSLLVGVVESKDDWQEFRIVDRRPLPPEATHVGLLAVMLGNGVALFDDLRLETAPRQATDDGNLLVNGHFESGVGEHPADFTLFGYPEEDPWWRWGSDAAHTGERGLHVKGDTTYVIFSHSPVPVEPGKRYVLRGWVRSRGGEAALKIDFLGDEYKWLGQQVGRSAEPDGNWHLVEMTANFKNFPAAKWISCAVFATEPGTDADYDDLSLTAAAAQ